MRRFRTDISIAAVAFTTSAFIFSAHAQTIDWQKVDDTLGRKPAVTEDVHRYGFPRSDLKVTLDGRPSRLIYTVRYCCQTQPRQFRIGARFTGFAAVEFAGDARDIVTALGAADGFNVN